MAADMNTLANLDAWSRKPLGRPGLIGVGAIIALLPAWLFADALATYRLYGDDFAYLGESRTLTRSLENLFTPHNAHVVPAWRLLSWALLAAAGGVGSIQSVLAAMSYGSLAASMILVGRLVARESASAAAGLAAMAAVGATSVMQSAGTWYSASQTLWAGLGILGSLWYLQGWRRAGGPIRLLLSAACCVLAGGFWTIGHASGPVGAVYLWMDGRRRCRLASIVPLLSSLVAAGLSLALGGLRPKAVVIGVHGRSLGEAIRPMAGLGHTLQAIPETLGFGNLGMAVETTPGQGALLSALMAAIWIRALVKGKRWPAPMEAAGLSMVFLSYWVEWSFRGYLPFASLRWPIVPWYDAVPHLGAVLFVAGWWSSGRGELRRRAAMPSRAQGALAVGFAALLVVLHQPRADYMLTHDALRLPPMSAAEGAIYPTPRLQRLRGVALGALRADWQRRALVRLDQAGEAARRVGIGRKAIARTFRRLSIPDLPEVDEYDAVDLIDVPEGGGLDLDPARVRRELGRFLEAEPPPTLPVPRLVGP